MNVLKKSTNRGVHSQSVDPGASWVSAAQRDFSSRLAKGESARTIGFSAGDGEVSRFFARYRLAAEYRNSAFYTFSSRTADCYSALIGLLLSYSSFEQCAAVSGLVVEGKLAAGKVDRLFEDSGIIKGAESLEPLRPVFRYLSPLVSSRPLRIALDKAADGEEILPRQLISALRHTFAHGRLSAHIGGLSPVRLSRGYLHLREELLRFQRAHISELMQIPSAPCSAKK